MKSAPFAALLAGTFLLIGCSTSNDEGDVQGANSAETVVTNPGVIDPLAKGTVLGMPLGTYEGKVTVTSEDWTSDVNADIKRTIDTGSIDLYYQPLTESVSAHLKVVATGSGAFDLLDYDVNWAKAGAGACDATSCSFHVKTFHGDWTLSETWEPTTAGFNVRNATQTLRGHPGSYVTSMTKAE